MSKPPIGQRGRNVFKKHDVVRAMRSAEKGGMDIGHVEVVTKDGTTIRVFGKTPAGNTNDLESWMAKRNANPA